MIVENSKIYQVMDLNTGESYRMCLSREQIKVFEFLNTCGNKLYDFSIEEEGEVINLVDEKC